MNTPHDISRLVWEHERAWMIYDWLKAEGTITRAKICKRLKLTDKSIQGIMGELQAHHYVIRWREGRNTYYQLRSAAMDADR